MKYGRTYTTRSGQNYSYLRRDIQEYDASKSNSLNEIKMTGKSSVYQVPVRKILAAAIIWGFCHCTWPFYYWAGAPVFLTYQYLSLGGRIAISRHVF